MTKKKTTPKKSPGLLDRIKHWIVRNKFEFLLLFTILLAGSLLRLLKISEYMTFLGDEGRDVIIVRRFLVNFDPILIGPGTSIGNMYLGPLYYYLMVPALFLANYSPIGPAIMIAVLGIITVFFVWYVAREWFGKVAAFASASLYSISYIVVHFSRSSWNPNIMPFFSLLAVYSAWRAWKKREYKWLIVLGISFAFVLQSHYLGLLLAPVLAILWLFSYLVSKNSGDLKKEFIKNSIWCLLVFGFLMSPLFIFDMRHGWMNFNAMKVFFTERQTTVSARPWTSLPKIPLLSEQILTSLMSGGNTLVAKSMNVIFFVYLLWFVKIAVKNIKKLQGLGQSDSGKLILLAWMAVSLIGLGLYKQHIYDHYFGFFFAAPFLLLGSLFQDLYNSKRFLSVALLIPVVVLLTIINIQASWLYKNPVNQLSRSELVSRKMIEESKGEKFNMAVIAERNYEGAYQYFLEKENANFVIIDPQREKETVAEYLYVVCELPKEKCDPTTNPKAGIANFGWSKIDTDWEIEGVYLFKLVHNKPEIKS